MGESSCKADGSIYVCDPDEVLIENDRTALHEAAALNELEITDNEICEGEPGFKFGFAILEKLEYEGHKAKLTKNFVLRGKSNEITGTHDAISASWFV